jgi:LuxR family maltose regulon positive regulatory protein
VGHARRALDLVPAAEAARRDQATALLGMTYLAGGDLQEADRVFTAYSRRLLAAGNVADALGTGCLLADIRPVLGRLRLAVDTVAVLRDAVLERGAAPPEMADLYRAWAELDLARGDVVAAGEHLWASSQLGQLRQMPVWAYRWHVARARLRLAQGDQRAALDLLEEAQRLFIRTPMPDLRPVPAMRARIWAEQGRVGDALSWARERVLSVDDDLDLVGEYEHLTLARILLADAQRGGSPAAGQAAVGLLDRLLRAAEAGGRVGSAIEILAVQATAHHHQGRPQAASAALQRALALAEPEGYLQVFLDQGHPMADLLRDHVARGDAPGRAAAVLAAFPQAGEGHTGAPGAPALSVREVEVLEHIAAGLTNQQIAAQLYLSPYTVKAHARSIYDKLDAHGRTAAVARARALGILPPR